MRRTCLTASSTAAAKTSQSSMPRQRRKHAARRVLLFDYRLNVIKRILIYVLITTRFVVGATDFDKSTTTAVSTTTTTTTQSRRITAASNVLSALILLLNRTSSAVFMSDDNAAATAVDAAAAAAAVVMAANGFHGSSFGIARMRHTNQTAKEFRKRNKRGTRDDLLAMATTAENTAASAMQQTATAMATMDKQQLASPSSTTATRILSRSKRFLTFPEGSSFSVAVCFTVGIIGNPRFNYMAFGLNWGVAYDLPNSTWVINHLHGHSQRPVPVTVLRRRTRRALYKEIEVVVDNMGYNGRDCVLRALCESRQYFSKSKLSMIGEMMRVVFSLPKQRIFTRELHENSEIEVYDRAYRRARDASCEKQYDCTFSLLELAFGKYSEPPKGYYQ